MDGARTPTVALAVAVSRGAVLVVRRRDRTPPLAFPGGKIEPGDSPGAAAEREVLEETGLRVVADAELGRRVHPTTDAELVYVACTAATTDITLAPAAREVNDATWVAAGDALDTMPDMFGPVRSWLRDIALCAVYDSDDRLFE